MSPRVVYVHGIGRAGDPDKHLEQWTTALATGMRKAGHSRLAEAFAAGTAISCVFGHYADLFETAGAQGGADDPTDADTEEILRGLLLELIEGHLSDPELGAR